LGAETGSEFPYLIPAGGGTAIRPGASMGPIAEIVLDPANHTGEVVVNEGRTLQLAPLVEFANLTYASLSPEVATVDAFGAGGLPFATATYIDYNHFQAQGG